ncbi:MAG TPA: EAL domain-containing protein [Steroidobacteraceae bacterium]|jgi:diguanylate cyclase (GGDEF)-like protein|nr:EAL domain-containing protein [Steroidobacteraceae bacterium]
MTTQSNKDAKLRLLLVEDSTADAELAIRRLQQAGYECSFERVVDEAQMRAALTARLPDIILSDFSLPQFDGVSALAIARELAPDVPFIFLSGTIGEERAIEALKSGAIDYVLKSNPKRLVPAVKRALQDASLRRQSRLAERRVARLSRVLQMLSGINSALVRIQSREEMLRETCRLAHRIGGYAVVMVGLINPETRMARPVGWAGYDFLQDPGREFPVADSEAGDTSLMGRVIRSGEATLCEDISSTAFTVHGRQELLHAGVRSLACLPLNVDGTPVGSFLCGTGSEATIDHDEMKLLEEVAANLSFALQYLDKQQAVHFLSYFEPLTGLAKRALFCERLSRLLTRGEASLPRLAVTVFDIDHLAVINDSFGRHTGDRLLQCVADRLKNHFPDSEQLAHLGGGTFVCMTALSSNEAEKSHFHEELTRVFDQPFVVDGRDVVARIKSGVACYPEDGREPNELVQNAEAALKEAKTSGERYLHHRIEMNSELARRVAMEQRLREAFAAEQFRLHYQPKIDLRSGRIVGAEALLRWQDPEGGLTSPGVFLPLLESAGLMPATDAWVLKQAVADCREWRASGFAPVRVAVNISPAGLRRRDIAREILGCIGDLAGDEQWGIDLEITEGAIADDSASCVHTLRLLRAAGMRIAIDDFGTGFSSLGRLSQLPIDTLKIDRAFVQRLPIDRKCCTLVSTIINLAHAFNLKTVAEGVEERPQLEYLARQGCDESQGFLHSRPVPRAEFEKWLSAGADSAPGLQQVNSP